MIKYGETRAEDLRLGQLPVEVMPVGRRGLDRGWLRKRGSALQDVRADLEPRAGHTYILSIPITAKRLSGSNRNADYWPAKAGRYRISQPPAGESSVELIKAGLAERAHTFRTNALMYRLHDNDDPEKSSGDIVAAIYNPKQGRVESISAVEDDTWGDELEKLASNEHVGVSMSARVPYDVCIVCKNRATKRADYCEHMRRYRNAILKDGTQVGVLNETPTFFDLSYVKRPADRVGFALSICKPTEGDKAASTDQRRKVLVGKLARMEKEIPAEKVKEIARGVDPRVRDDADEDTIMVIKVSDPGVVGRELQRSKVVLSPRDFARSIDREGHVSDSMISGMISRLPTLFRDMLSDMPCDMTAPFEPSGTLVVPEVRKVVRGLEPDHSLGKPQVKKRITISMVRHPNASPPVEEPEEKEDEKKEASSGGIRKLAMEYGKYLVSFLDSSGGKGCEKYILAANRVIQG